MTGISKEQADIEHAKTVLILKHGSLQNAKHAWLRDVYSGRYELWNSPETKAICELMNGKSTPFEMSKGIKDKLTK